MMRNKLWRKRLERSRKEDCPKCKNRLKYQYNPHGFWCAKCARFYRFDELTYYKIKKAKKGKTRGEFVEDLLYIILEEFIGEGKQTLMKAVSSVSARCDRIEEILIEEFKLQIGALKVKIERLEEKIK